MATAGCGRDDSRREKPLPRRRCGSRALVFALLVELLDVYQIVLWDDHAVGRGSVPGLGHQDDPKGIDVDDARRLAIDSDAPTRQVLPGHDVTCSPYESVVTMALFMSHDLFELSLSRDPAAYPPRPTFCRLAQIAPRGAKEE